MPGLSRADAMLSCGGECPRCMGAGGASVDERRNTSRGLFGYSDRSKAASKSVFHEVFRKMN